MSRLKIMAFINKERIRQDEIWNRQAGDWPVPDGERLAILGEEFGEVCRALCEKDSVQLERELVHLCAIGVCWLEVIAAKREERSIHA